MVKLKEFLSSPTAIVFELTLVGAILSWGIRQEYINRHQQYLIDQRIPTVDLERRLLNIEIRLERLEKTK